MQSVLILMVASPAPVKWDSVEMGLPVLVRNAYNIDGAERVIQYKIYLLHRCR